MDEEYHIAQMFEGDLQSYAKKLNMLYVVRLATLLAFRIFLFGVLGTNGKSLYLKHNLIHLDVTDFTLTRL